MSILKCVDLQIFAGRPWQMHKYLLGVQASNPGWESLYERICFLNQVFLCNYQHHSQRKHSIQPYCGETHGEEERKAARGKSGGVRIV